MKILFYPLIILILSTGIAYAETPEQISISVKTFLKQDEKSNTYFVLLEETTDLPDNSIINVTFSYQFPGSENDRYLDYKNAKVKGGICKLQWGPYRQKPPPGKYVFKIAFNPDRQYGDVSEIIKIKYGEVQQINQTEYLVIGESSEEPYQARDKMINIIKKSGENLKALFDEFKQQFPKYTDITKKPENIESFKTWSNNIIEQLDAILKPVLEEDELRVFDLVNKHKGLVENSVFLVKSLLQKMRELLELHHESNKNPKDKETTERLSSAHEAVLKIYELTERELKLNFNELGLVIIDKTLIIEPLNAIEKIIRNNPDDGKLNEQDIAIITRQMLQMSQKLPAVYYEKTRDLAYALSSATQGNPINKQTKEKVLQEIKKLKEGLE